MLPNNFSSCITNTVHNLKVGQQFLKNLFLHYLSTKRTFLEFTGQMTEEYSHFAGLALIWSLLSLADTIISCSLLEEYPQYCRNNFVIWKFEWVCIYFTGLIEWESTLLSLWYMTYMTYALKECFLRFLSMIWEKATKSLKTCKHKSKDLLQISCKKINSF